MKNQNGEQLYLKRSCGLSENLLQIDKLEKACALGC